MDICLFSSAPVRGYNRHKRISFPVEQSIIYSLIKEYKHFVNETLIQLKKGNRKHSNSMDKGGLLVITIENMCELALISSSPIVSQLVFDTLVPLLWDSRKRFGIS